MYAYSTYASAVGDLHLLASESALLAVLWEQELPFHFRHLTFNTNHQNPIILQTKQQLAEYFQGTRKHFNLPVDFLFGTPFQHLVWQSLQQIPYGQTISYQQQAVMIQRPKAIRAVGAANGKNPLSIIIPCHRVIGKDGQLTGFGGGLENKKYLLTLEQKFL